MATKDIYVTIDQETGYPGVAFENPETARVYQPKWVHKIQLLSDDDADSAAWDQFHARTIAMRDALVARLTERGLTPEDLHDLGLNLAPIIPALENPPPSVEEIRRRVIARRKALGISDSEGK